MPEIFIDRDSFFRYTQSDKKSSLCRVRFCMNRRVKGRHVCHRCRKKLWRARNPMLASFRGVKDRATRKGIEFGLTFEQFKEIAETTGYIESKGRTCEQLHLDRVDSSRGYVLGNLQVITCSENSAKGNREKYAKLRSLGVVVAESDDDADPF